MHAGVKYLDEDFSASVQNITRAIEHPGAGGPQENYPNDVAMAALDEPVSGVATVVSASRFSLVFSTKVNSRG
jgi:hypothetical protein